MSPPVPPPLTPDDSLDTVLSFSALPENSRPLALRIIHTNDIHSHFSPFNRHGTDCTDAQFRAEECFGGAARVKTVVEGLRSQHPNSILLDGGDQFQGTMFYNFYKGNISVEVMNDLQYDAMSLGNHEFDDTPSNVIKFANQLNFPIVAANIDASDYPEFQAIIKPYIILEQYNLGIIGYITNTTGDISNAGPLLKFLDPAPAVNKYVDELRSKGIKRIIAVSHNGYREDIDLASRTRGLSLIVGGHSHTYLASDPSEPGAGGRYPTAVSNLDGKTTYIVQAKCWGEYVGFVDLVFDPTGSAHGITGHPIHITQALPVDEPLAIRVQEWRKPFDEYTQTVIGEATDEFSTNKCYSNECTIGDLVADAMLDFRKPINPRFAVINAGGIRAGIAKGPITIGQILTILPFGNALVDIKLTGAELKESLLATLNGVHPKNGKRVTSIVQVSGIRFTATRDADGKFTKLDSFDIITEDGKSYMPVVETETYVGVTLDFLATGGDNVFGGPLDGASTALDTLDVVVQHYIQDRTPITPKLDGRIQITY
ncbi:Metallo-dependent phosphatase [Ramicandelaber brevisporus]|nr:Metallo-dependent phosphatase [Ramicandelaber brevisporus]